MGKLAGERDRNNAPGIMRHPRLSMVTRCVVCHLVGVYGRTEDAKYSMLNGEQTAA